MWLSKFLSLSICDNNNNDNKSLAQFSLVMYGESGGHGEHKVYDS